MDTFLSIHEKSVIGTLSTFDRLIFKGHFLCFYPGRAFARFLSKQNVLLKDFGAYAQQTTGELKAHVEQVAAEAGRPLIYLAKACTARKGNSKEAQARALAEKDNVSNGLICARALAELVSLRGSGLHQWAGMAGLSTRPMRRDVSALRQQVDPD